MKDVVLIVAGLVFTKLLDGAEAKWRFERVYLVGGWFGAHGSYARVSFDRGCVRCYAMFSGRRNETWLAKEACAFACLAMLMLGRPPRSRLAEAELIFLP